MLLLKLVGVVYLLFISVTECFNHTNLEDQHVCAEYISKTEQLTYTVLETFKTYERKWCLKYPFRCTKETTDYKNVTKHRIVPVKETIYKCCSGYEYDLNSNECKPKCQQGCNEPNGQCIEPEICLCEAGYVGYACDLCLTCGTGCPEGFYGVNCDLQCNCYNNATCDPVTGACTCTEGWRDEDCNTTCPKYYFGINCTERCNANQTVCDHVTGEDHCRNGYIGNFCEKPCGELTFGRNCTGKCQCKNNSTCNNIDGSCDCKPGWKGSTCSTPCDKGTFGPNCLQTCLCSNETSTCSPIDGQCRCFNGFKGLYCTEQCNYGYYGEHCSTPCNCPSENYLCDHISGCICPDDFTGELCDVNIHDKYEPLESVVINNNSGLYVVIAILIIVIISIVVGFAFFYYHRKQKMKREMEEELVVKYMANSFATEERMPLNNQSWHIVNDLGFEFSRDSVTQTTSNPGYFEKENTKYDVPSSKNVEADSTNPNLDKKNQKYTKSDENLGRYLNMKRISEIEDENIYESVEENLDKNYDQLMKFR